MENYPEPTESQPSLAVLEEMADSGTCLTTDGCEVEPDGVCEHGYPSWLLHLGLI